MVGTSLLGTEDRMEEVECTVLSEEQFEEEKEELIDMFPSN